MILIEAENAVVNEAKLVFFLSTFGSTKHILGFGSELVKFETFVKLTRCN